ncbi:MAG: ABC transporter permease [Acidimicrobiia bacterium]|jgi:lipooligosaccharide transport system permease protein
MITTRHAARVVERNVLAYRRMWFIFLTGFAEPILFLLSIGVGVGSLVGELQVGGQTVEYDQFVAPGLLAMSAMSGALLDATFNFFVKYKYTKVYDAVLATPVGTSDLATGEVVWSLLRGAIYSTFFLLTMVAFGLVTSWWAVLAIPVAVLIGFAFAGAGLAATTWMRSFLDFDYVNLAIVPLFLFSATFFPLSQYPTAVEAIVRVTPLYQGVVLERSLVLGDVHWSMLLNAAYLLVMGGVGVRIANRRLARLLQP